MITSLNCIQEKIGKHISLFQIRHAIKRFENMGFLVNKSSKTGRLITICNWERYQSKELINHKDVAQNGSSSSQDRHQNITPNKNVKNEKNSKKENECDYLSIDDINTTGFTPEELKDPALLAWLAEG